MTHLLLAALVTCSFHSRLPLPAIARFLGALRRATARIRLLMASLGSPDFALGGLWTTVGMCGSSIRDTTATTSGARRRSRGQSVHESKGCIWWSPRWLPVSETASGRSCLAQLRRFAFRPASGPRLNSQPSTGTVFGGSTTHIYR